MSDALSRERPLVKYEFINKHCTEYRPEKMYDCSQRAHILPTNSTHTSYTHGFIEQISEDYRIKSPQKDSKN
jgi:hypothetical protein